MDYSITSGADTTKGIKTVIYGVEGIGKTTLASHFPDPVFIDTEGSTTHFSDIQRMPTPKNWKDLRDMVSWISKEKPCKTLVIDTFDWAEMAEVEDLMKEQGWMSIEAPGYGKGYILSAERIAAFLKDMEKQLIDEGINVVLNCHAQIRKFELPEEQGSYDKYELKLGNKTTSRTSPLVKEWADLILFCNYKTYVEMESKGMGQTNGKATGGQERMMYAQRSAVWDAKNRFGLPEEMPMDFKYLEKIFDRTPAKAEKKAADKPKKAKKAERQANVDKPGAMIFPDLVPEDVKALCEKESYRADDIQRLLYREGIVKTETYPLEKVPKKFWDSFVKEYETRWAEKLFQARQDNLPF